MFSENATTVINQMKAGVVVSLEDALLVLTEAGGNQGKIFYMIGTDQHDEAMEKMSAVGVVTELLKCNKAMLEQIDEIAGKLPLNSDEVMRAAERSPWMANIVEFAESQGLDLSVIRIDPHLIHEADG